MSPVEARGVLVTPTGRRPGMLQNSLKCTRLAPTPIVNCLKRSAAPEVEKSWEREKAGGAATPTRWLPSVLHSPYVTPGTWGLSWGDVPLPLGICSTSFLWHSKPGIRQGQAATWEREQLKTGP